MVKNAKEPAGFELAASQSQTLMLNQLSYKALILQMILFSNLIKEVMFCSLYIPPAYSYLTSHCAGWVGGQKRPKNFNVVCEQSLTWN